MILALPILYLYNGKKGKFAEKHKKFSKWVFYIIMFRYFLSIAYGIIYNFIIILK